MHALPRNPLCPYCQTVLVDSENNPNGRSVEHLIPNTVLTIPRTKRDGDFFACRRCNSAKSHIDYILGVVAKARSGNAQLASDALLYAVNSNDGRAGRLVRTVKNFERSHKSAKEILRNFPFRRARPT